MSTRLAADARKAVQYRSFPEQEQDATMEAIAGWLAKTPTAESTMSTRFPCYLAPLRKEWDLSQEELAALLPRASRNRVSDVESGKAVPNAEEILAYSLVFGFPPHRIFPRYVETLEDTVMRNAHQLYERLKDDPSPEARMKRELLEKIPGHATSTGPDNLPV